MSLFDSASLIVTPSAYKAGKLYSLKPTDGAGDLSVTRATTATRVNSNGLIESVASGVPRIDYTNGSCPSILVEPQRTNLLLRSEEFDNIIWSLGLSATISANTSISPDGTQNADTLTLINAATSRIQQTIIATSSTYTISIYAKSNVSKKFRFRIITSGTSQISNDFTTSNVWQRYSFTFTSDILRIEIINESLAVAGSLDIWGAQLEVGSNATSYIPTTLATVTRNADVISKTGISDLIGQTEGTVYLEGHLNNLSISTSRVFLTLFNDSTLQRIGLSVTSTNNINLFVSDGVASSLNSIAVSNGKVKMAVSYENLNFKFFVNGSYVGAITNRNVPNAMNKVNLGSAFNGTLQTDDFINSTILWKTILTDQECINLTSI